MKKLAHSSDPVARGPIDLVLTELPTPAMNGWPLFGSGHFNYRVCDGVATWDAPKLAAFRVRHPARRYSYLRRLDADAPE
jgi:hypothetical protein